MQKIKAKIHLGNIRRNAEKFSALTKKRLCAVVKANAYGHGAEEVTSALHGVADCFAVAILEEGIALRAVCGESILVFTPPIDEEESYVLAVNGLTASVGDLWTAKLLFRTCEKYRLPLKVHLKINTGMNRYGMNVSELGKVCKFLLGNPFITVEGIYSHLYACDVETSRKQRGMFVQAIAVCKRYYPKVLCHLSATYGSLLGEKFSFDMTRVGIGLYGYLPSGAEALGERLHLEKGMTVYAPIVASRKYSFGGMGYGTPTALQKPTRISINRYGYADGFLRQANNGTLHAEENVNTLCMDVCLKDNGKRRGVWTAVMTDADEVARQTGTISYEVLCAATRRAEFVYDND